MDISAVDVSSMIGLVAMWLLTVNILLGLLISTRYNPVRQWPHKRINIFKLHNWNAYLALSVAVLHPGTLLLSKTAGFHLLDVLAPLHSPHQTFYNNLGALTFYLLVFVVVTSYFRPRLGHKRWKPLHYATSATAAVLFVHGILIDPNLKDQPTDFLDGEKLQGELCALLVIAGTVWRIRYGLKKRKAREVTALA
ncbi:MAG: ferric reductase-like transmembrane domain-containing protein [Acidobacteriaceae bacterium]|nr:ferric reductase-like transmembrane domain-containing protein [Acidobacteriaceae bacterium]